MTEHDAEIQALLDRHTAVAVDLEPNWADVTARAADRPSEHRRFALRGAVLLAAAITLLLVGSALAGVGPGRLLVGLVRGDHPEPRAASTLLDETFHWPHGTHVLTAESKLVYRQLQLESYDPQHHRAIRDLSLSFIAPIAGGGYCSGYIDRDPATGRASGSQYGCLHGLLRPAIRLGTTGLRAWRDSSGRLRGVSGLLDGTAPKATATITLIRRDGHTNVPLSNATFPGFRYFALPLGPGDVAATAAPVALVARNAAGHVLATLKLEPSAFKPLIVNSTLTDNATLPPTTPIRFGTIQTTGGNVTQGKPGTVTVALEVTTRTHAVTCIDTTVIGTATSTMGCGIPVRGFAPGIDTNTGVHLAYGVAPQGTRSVKIVLANGAVAPGRLHDSIYLAVLQDAWFNAGNLPQSLIARDADNKVLARYRFNRANDFPDY